MMLNHIFSDRDSSLEFQQITCIAKCREGSEDPAVQATWAALMLPRSKMDEVPRWQQPKTFGLDSNPAGPLTNGWLGSSEAKRETKGISLFWRAQILKMTRACSQGKLPEVLAARPDLFARSGKAVKLQAESCWRV